MVVCSQRDTKKKPRQKRSNIPSAKRDGVSSFSTGFTPVYIQSGNPYPITPIPPVPDATPIRVPIEQRNVSSLVNPPVTSTTNLAQQARSILPVPLSFGTQAKTPLLSESGMNGRGIMHYKPSPGNSKFPSNPLNSVIVEKAREKIEKRNMGNQDINKIVKKIIQSNPLNSDILKGAEKMNEKIENRTMGNEDIVDINRIVVKKNPRIRRTKEEIEQAKLIKTQKQIDKDISKTERDLMKQEDTRRKEQLKRERNERNRMGRNDINAIDIRGL